MQSSRAFYAVAAPSGECPHERLALCRDVTVAAGIGPWYVECFACGLVGPNGETPAAAVAPLVRAAYTDGLGAVADALEVLVLCQLADAGDLVARETLAEASAAELVNAAPPLEAVRDANGVLWSLPDGRPLEGPGWLMREVLP